MCNQKHLAAIAALCFSISACQVDRIEIPEEELFTREFIKNYGIISSDQDWSVLKRAKVNVTVAGTTDVRILAKVDGKTQLLAHYSGVSGSRDLEFDCPKQVDEVLVKTTAYFGSVPVGGEVTIGPTSRAIDGTDRAPGYSIANGYFWGNKYVGAIQKILPEDDPNNIASANIVSDFSFISTGKPFVFYPIYWQTTGDDVLGVYWYEDGEMKTMDLFGNKIIGKDENGKDAELHNIYHRVTQGEDLVITSSAPAEGAVAQPIDGSITLSFNRQVKMRSTHSATISSGTLTGPAIAADGKSAIYTYSGVNPKSEVTFWVNGGSFEAVDNKEGDLKTAMNQTYSFKFTTKDTRAIWTGITYMSSAYDVSAGLSGTIVMTFDSNVSRGSGNVTLTAEDGSAAVVGEVTVSNNTVTIPYSGASLETSYALAIPDGFLKGADGNSVSLEGFDKEVRNVMKTPGYKYGPGIQLPLNLELKGGVVTTESGSTIASDAVMNARILYKDACTVKVTNKGVSDLRYTLAGSGDALSFNYGIRSKMESGLTGTVGVENINGTEYSLIEISPEKDVLLTVYGFREANDKVRSPQIWDNTLGRKVEDKYLWYESQDVNIDTITKTWIAYAVSGLVTAGSKYMVFAYPGEQGRIAGLSYQLQMAEVDFGSIHYSNSSVASVRSRTQASDGTVSDLGINGTVPDFFVEGQEPGHGFVRGTRNNKYAISEKGNDEVLTHRISFTLKKGVIFGFYLRNAGGANNITNLDGNKTIVPYTNYSMSSLNKDMPNSFFNKVNPSSGDAPFFASGWGTKDSSGNYHGDLYKDGKRVEVPDNRKYSTASTYTTRINGMEIRYFSFEDWVDYDFNDIAFMVAPESTDTEIVDNEVSTNPYIYAVEDLGATASTDIDFNDIVFAVEHVSGRDSAFVTMLAAGGTLKAQLYYDGKMIDGNSFGDIVDGVHAGDGATLSHVNEWFGIDTHGVAVNVGSGVQTGFGALTTVRIPVGEGFSLTGTLDDIGRDKGFFVEVEREDGRTTQITRPDHNGEAPQIIILPGTWHWPLERVAISEAYPGGINYDGTYLPSFRDWVSSGDKGFQMTDWHKAPKHGAVMGHPWNGSEAARKYFNKKQ